MYYLVTIHSVTDRLTDRQTDDSIMSQSNQLIIPPVKLSTYGPRSFAVAGPTIWNNLPEYLRDPELSIENFRSQLKTFLFAQ